MQDQLDYEAFLSGDNNGFENLLLRYKDMLIAFIMRYVGNLHTAEDISQDVFAEVFVFKDRFNPEKNFKTYIYTIAHHKAVDYIRKNSRLTQIEESFSDENYGENFEDKILDNICSSEENRRLYAAIGKLKKNYADVVYLVYFENLSCEQAAHALEITTASLKVILHRARKKLKTILETEVQL